MDTDLNPTTGDLTFGDDVAGIPLNGIGADHRIILSSLIARDTALAYRNNLGDPAFWDLVFDTTGFNYHNVPSDTNVLEFGIDWNDLNNSYGAYIVSFHFYFIDLITGVADWVPNRGGGFVMVAKEARYIGAPFSAGKRLPMAKPEPSPALIRFNPFE